MNISERDADKRERGARARIAEEYYRAELEAKRDKIVSELCFFYVNQELDFPVICGKLGELSLIESTLSRFERDIKQSETTEGKLYGRGPSTS